ncbi:hypothetical protein OG883_14715 [Streptomyces sp. NBC_01142]|nr:hypothetical protein [Streptomyces sp. NBC_01142]MCX4821144.1 hypothetical protein [Streptomyces sp. NBC_01142]
MSRTNATAADYDWLDDHCAHLTEAYCRTLSKGSRAMGCRRGWEPVG